MVNVLSGLVHGFQALSTPMKFATVAMPIVAAGGIATAALLGRNEPKFSDDSYLPQLAQGYGVGTAQAQAAYDEVRSAIPGIEKRDPGAVVLSGTSGVSAALVLTETALATGQSGTDVAQRYTTLDGMISGEQSVYALGMFIGDDSGGQTHTPADIADTYAQVRDALPDTATDEDLALATYAIEIGNSSFEAAINDPFQSWIDVRLREK